MAQKHPDPYDDNPDDEFVSEGGTDEEIELDSGFKEDEFLRKHELGGPRRKKRRIPDGQAPD